MFQRRGRSTAFVHVEPHAFDPPAHSGTVLANMWAAFRRGPLVVGIVPGVTHAQALAVAECISTRLRVHKLVLIEPEGGIASRDGTAISFMDDATLSALLQAGEAEWTGLAARRATFEAVRAALRGGVGSVNLCALEGLARELFTYAGSGTLFTMADYCTVARLGIDDFEEVERLIERGQREGVLKLRTAEEVAAMLVNGYGATIGMHHLAGICALLTEPYRADNAGEVVGLYAITRFKGEGIGARLLARIVDDARSAALSYLFACTTEDRAQLFFERAGFRRVDAAAVPAEKWAGYDAARKPVVAVFRLDLGATPKAHMP